MQKDIIPVTSYETCISYSAFYINIKNLIFTWCTLSSRRCPRQLSYGGRSSTFSVEEIYHPLPDERNQDSITIMLWVMQGY
jgi:hypothetical protein